MKDTLIGLVAILALFICVYSTIKDEQQEDKIAIQYVKKYPQCASAKIPRYCGELLDKAGDK